MVKRARVEHRPKVHKDLGASKEQSATESKAEPGHNSGQSREEYLFFVGQMRAVEKKEKDLKAEKKRLRSNIKLRGYSIGAMVEAMKEQDRQDGTTIKEMKILKTYYEWMDLPIGHQMQLFDDPQVGKSFDQEAILKRAYQEGFDLGIQGLNSDRQKYPPMTPEGREHDKGWNDAQDRYRSRIKDLSQSNAEAASKAAARRAAKKPEDSEDGENAREAATVN